MSEVTSSKQLRELIRILERKLGALKDFQTTCCGVTMAQCHALVEIGRLGNISLNELSRLLNLDNSTMSRTVNNLVNRNLARREVDPQDRRYITIFLTEDGEKVFMAIEESMNIYYKNVYTLIPEDKKKQVLESLEILLEAISNNK
ncbi:MarR family winged helix-turn-helix transcriptional regulator [Clostridium sp. WILCCON 0269]|uniref:MarR family winged helix-turn-helix transcriptional regulator n=1 Tax=Candidatus Clostridium eludens TaxID=3381663 RepID=A0ABW8SJI4_9CLOT